MRAFCKRISVSEEAFPTTDEIAVTVDGEAATRVETASALRTAADGGSNSAFMIRQATTAAASADVVVGINHFSERELEITSDEDGTQTPGEDGPGFGVLVAIVALVGAALIAMRRRVH